MTYPSCHGDPGTSMKDPNEGSEDVGSVTRGYNFSVDLAFFPKPFSGQD